MKISYSELICIGNPVLENVQKLIHAGADGVELMMDGPSWDTMDDNWNKLAKELKKMNIPFSVHPPAWDTNLTSQMYELRKASWDLHVKALHFAAEIGASQMVLHPGFFGWPSFDKEVAKRRAREITVQLSEIAKPLGVRLAFENVGGPMQSLYTFDEYSCALDGIDENVGYLIDIGHANMNGWDIPRLIRKVSNRLFGLHIHDNNGKIDEHLPIYDGNLNWEEIFAAMRCAGEDCEFILEYLTGIPLEKLSEGKELLKKQVWLADK